MRFKEFIREARHREDISIEKTMELLEANCKDAMENFDSPLWRGSRQMSEESYLVTGEAGGRRSANTQNYYTLILDHFLPNYGYPKRSKSIICANNSNRGYAMGYGTLYAIFPYDGVKIGVCPDKDMWYTHVTVGEAKTKMIKDWNEIFRSLDINDDSYVDFKNSVISTMNSDKMKNGHHSGVLYLLDAFGSNPTKVETVLKDAYNPEGMKMHLATSADIGKYEDKAREIWISRKCIAIRADIWEKMSDDRNIR